MRHFMLLRGVLIAGVVFGFGSGLVSLAHHGRWACQGEGWRHGEAQAPTPQPVVVPAAAPQIILVMPTGGAPGVAPVVVVQPQPAPAAQVAPAHPTP